MNLFEMDREYLLPLYRRLPVQLVRGEGMHLYDDTGKPYLDFAAGIAVNALGYGHPRVLEAMKAQMEQYLHISNYFPSPSLAGLAKLLVEHSFGARVFFANSGTEANEAMIKLARKHGRSRHPDKVKFVALERSFHGRTHGGMTLTGNPAYRTQFAPLMEGVVHVPLNDAKALAAAVDDDTCGIFLEPIQGESGVRPLSQEFVAAVKAAAERHDALILLDEVQTGLLRTGKLFAYQHFDLVPDAMTLAKALGGGLPLGAMVVSKRLEHVLAPGDHGSTFGGNPLAGAAGKALLEVLLEDGFEEHVNAMADRLQAGLLQRMQQHPQRILEIRGKGLMLGVEVGPHAVAIRGEALSRGLILNVTGGTVLRLLPPLILEEADVAAFFEIFDATLQVVFRDL